MLNFAKPYLTAMRACALTGALTLTLTACGGGKWGFPYRPDVQQGNWITAQQVEQLQEGMTREQVQYLLGTPTLQNVFRDNRWDYPYYNKPGYGEIEQRIFTVWFDGDFLTHWDGDNQPNRQPFEKSDTGADASNLKAEPDTDTETNVETQAIN